MRSGRGAGKGGNVVRSAEQTASGMASTQQPSPRAAGVQVSQTVAEAFRLDDRPALAPSQVTRWETGQIAADATVVRRHENLLALPDDSLTIVGEAYATFLDGPVSSAEQDHQFDDDSLHELLERASTTGAMGGRDWRKLALLISPADRSG